MPASLSLDVVLGADVNGALAECEIRSDRPGVVGNAKARDAPLGAARVRAVPKEARQRLVEGERASRLQVKKSPVAAAHQRFDATGSLESRGPNQNRTQDVVDDRRAPLGRDELGGVAAVGPDE